MVAPNAPTAHSESTAAGAALEASDRERLRTQEQLFERARGHLPRDPFPHYLAHLRLLRDPAVDLGAGDAPDGDPRGNEGAPGQPRQLDVLFIHGPQPDRSPEPQLVIANWQTSRFSELLFGCKEGDRYELATALGRITGQVLELNLTGFRDAELAHLLTPERRLSLSEKGNWERWPRAASLLEPRPAEAQARTPSLIDVSLDPAQRAAVELPTERSVLVLGEAGHGKTTVALHRLARLYKAAAGSFRAAVIVPTDGLRRLIEPMLRSLGVDVEVEIFERWAAAQARAVFSDLPERESQDATAGVIRFKRDPALREALATLVESRRPAAAKAKPKRVPRKLEALAKRRDLLHLFGDRSLVARVLGASSQALGAHVLAEVLEHARVQFSRTTEQEFSHVVDKSRLRAVDGRPLDEGTPTQDAGSIDTEDYAVLFELDRMKAAQRGRPAVSPPIYDCLLIDEAQELAPLELALIGRSLAPGGSLIVAGDADQQTDPTVCFSSWEHSMRELGCSGYERVVLPVSYRCPPQVVAIARGLIGAAPASPRPAQQAPFVHALNECHLASWLLGELEQLTRRDPTASVALICRVPSTARRLQAALRQRSLGRLVLDGEFLFRSGVNVTELDQVKGLEFDYVIVPDASQATYPDTPEAHRALYVAVTRTRHQLLLGAVAGQSPLLGLPSILP
jgi:DNA helicase-2/ATP-dependent DNA helicase PcrA